MAGLESYKTCDWTVDKYNVITSALPDHIVTDVIQLTSLRIHILTREPVDEDLALPICGTSNVKL